MDKAIYTKLDLVSYTGVGWHTIRSWVTRGVIPPAYKRGGSPHCWGQEHIDAIRRVQDIRDNNVTLTDLAVRYGYKPNPDGYDEAADDEMEDDILDVLDSLEIPVSSLEQVDEGERGLDENDEPIPEWDDSRVHPGWFRR